MNVIAIMNHMGVYFKEEPIRERKRQRSTVLTLIYW
ncbi:lysine decarboxylase 1 [Klebsiella pneumoniae]|nr:lysine decarboxylase 1 [Klebsiella pneumoniae]